MQHHVGIYLSDMTPQYTAVGIRRRYQGFVSIRDTYPGGAAAFFENVTTNAIVLRNVAWDFQVALGDAIVVRSPFPLAMN